MQEIQYKTFSLNTHKKNWHLKSPNVCQFELTFKCGLHCKYCYTDCYNKPDYFGEELNTEQVKLILDKVYSAGVIWVCFTGGDPLTRKDFLDIYAYAQKKGVIITVFTNGYSMTEETAGYFKKSSPFVIEMTLNAVTEDLYEKISQVRGSFKKTMRGIDLILKAKLPLKIKTQITKDNLEEIPRIRKFLKAEKLKFYPSFDLYARLNGDLAPCSLRISHQELLNINGRREPLKDECLISSDAVEILRRPANGGTPQNDNGGAVAVNLFRCAISGGDGIHLDPYGNMFSCILIREPSFSLLKADVNYARNKLLSLVRGKTFTTDSKCKACNLKQACRCCPGRAYVETGDMEAPVEYYCKLAYETAKLP